MANDPRSLPTGVLAASLTPLRDDLSIDHGALAGHGRWLLENGCHGIALFGTTGEASSFSVAERMAALDAVLETGLPPNRILVGTGCCSVPDTVALTRHAMGCEAGGVLMLPPFYYKGVKDEGVFSFYDQVIQEAGDPGLRICLYHIPQLTGVPLSHGLIKELTTRHPDTVRGIKDSGGDLERMKGLCRDFPGFQVLAGTEKFLLPVLEAGGSGCISATVNVTSRLAREVYENRERAEAGALQARLTVVREAIEAYPMIPALKALMAKRTGVRAWLNLRPPLSPVGEVAVTL